MQAAVELVHAAQAASCSGVDDTPQQKSPSVSAQPQLRVQELAQGAHTSPPFVWRNGMLRCAADQKQVQDMAGAAGLAQQGQQQQLPLRQEQAPEQRPPSLPLPAQPAGERLDWCPVHLVSAHHLQRLLPGIHVPTLGETGSCGTDGSSSAAGALYSTTPRAAVPRSVNQGFAGFYVPKGVVLSVPQYLQQLWAACQAAAAAGPHGSSASLRLQQVRMGCMQGCAHAALVAAGALGRIAAQPRCSCNRLCTRFPVVCVEVHAGLRKGTPCDGHRCGVRAFVPRPTEPGMA